MEDKTLKDLGYIEANFCTGTRTFINTNKNRFITVDFEDKTIIFGKLKESKKEEEINFLTFEEFISLIPYV